MNSFEIRTSMHAFPLILLLFAFTGLDGQPVLADKIVGIVDDRMVTLSEVESQYLQYKYQQTGPLLPDFKCMILDQMLSDQLLARQAELDSITVADEEVERQLDLRIRTFANAIGSMEKLEEYYGKSILEIKDEFRDEIRDRMLAEQERQSIVTDLKVTPSEVQQFFRKIPQDSLPYFNAELEIGQIVIIPKVNPLVKAYSREKIEELLVRVRNGENFAALASAYSDDPGSAEQGGELGFVNRGELDPNFEAAAFSLKKPNDISDVVESVYGFHIIQLIERRGDRINVRHILVKPRITTQDISRAGFFADSIYQLVVTGKYTFVQAVDRFSEDEETKGNSGMLTNPRTQDSRFEADDLGNFDQSLVMTTDTLKPGELSQPMIFRTRQGENAFRMVFLKSKTPPHQMNLKDDYDRVQQMALNEKSIGVIEKWMTDRISKSYVFVAPEYKGCTPMKKWIPKDQ